MTRDEEIRIIRRARAGDGDAMAALVRAHQQGLYAFILRMSANPHVAEDIVQEAFVRVLRNLDRFDERFRFSTWVFTIAKRLYVNAMQKHKPVFDSDTVAARASEGQGDPDLPTLRDESLRDMRSMIELALEALNPQQREVVLLFHQQSWSIGDIATHLGMPEGTVKSHLHRARKRMRAAIDGCEKLSARAEEVWS